MFLCWRWWRRIDLPELLRAACHPAPGAALMPELQGFERFAAAAKGAFDVKEELLDRLLIAAVLDELPTAGVIVNARSYTRWLLDVQHIYSATYCMAWVMPAKGRVVDP